VKAFLSEFKFIILFLVLVTGVSGFTNFEALNEAPPINLKETVLLAKVEAKQVHPKQRGLASVNSEAGASLNKSFFCNHSNDSKAASSKVSKNLVMLNFKLCKDQKKIAMLTLMNKTNGFKAQIFQPDWETYKTDYIQLSEGSNNIVVEVVLKDGQISRESLVILTGS
jgi:hypothetical protein